MGTEKCQKRVLVVEDNELNRKIAAQVIEDEGILTECAIDGLEAVKKVREAPQCHLDKDYTKNSVYRNMYPVLFL